MRVSHELLLGMRDGYIGASITLSPIWCAVMLIGFVFSGEPIGLLLGILFSPAVVGRAIVGRGSFIAVPGFISFSATTALCDIDGRRLAR